MKGYYRFFISAGTIFLMIFSICSFSIAYEPSLEDIYDVNKHWETTYLNLYPHPDRDTDDTDDRAMCWAATASNLITYNGWAVDRSDLGEQGPLEFHVYHDLLSAFPNSGGYLKTALESYFSWYYPDLEYEDYYVSEGDEEEIVDKFQEYINDGYTLSLGVWSVSSTGSILSGHAISCWGYDNINDENGDDDNLIEYYKAYVTDSDDYDFRQYGLIDTIWEYYYLKELKNTTIELVIMPDYESGLEGLYAYGGKLKSLEGLSPKPLFLRDYFFSEEGIALFYDQISPWGEGDETSGNKITHGGKLYYYKDSSQQTFMLTDLPELARVDSPTDPSQKSYRYNGIIITDYLTKTWHIGNQPRGEKIVWNGHEFYYDFIENSGFFLEEPDRIIEKKYRNQIDILYIPIDYDEMISEHQEEFQLPPIHPNPEYAVNDKYDTDEDTILIIPNSTGLLYNDKINAITEYSTEVDVFPTYGAISLDIDGSFEYTPNPDYYGTDIFSYKLINVTAGNIEINTAIVLINIRSVNDPPVISISDTFSGYEGSPVSFSGSATDIEGDTISYFWDFDNDDTWDATGTDATFTWYDDFAKSIVFQALDDKGASSIENPCVNIENINPAVYSGINFEIFSGESVQFLGSYIDPGEDSHIIEWDFDDKTYSFDDLSPTHTFYESKLHSVKLTVEDDDGGVGTDSLEVEVNPKELLLDIHPPMLNSKSTGKWITGYIEFIGNYNVEEIEETSIILNGISAENKPISIGDYNKNGISDLMFKIDRFSLLQFAIFGVFDLEVQCELVDGTQFIGYDTILIF